MPYNTSPHQNFQAYGAMRISGKRQTLDLPLRQFHEQAPFLIFFQDFSMEEKVWWIPMQMTCKQTFPIHL